MIENLYVDNIITGYACRGGGSNFTLGRQNLWTLLNVWKNVDTHIYTQATFTAQSTISMQGMLMLGIWEHAPPGKF